MAGTPEADDSARAAQWRRLRWRSRRGLLENDVVLGRFFAGHPEGLSAPAGEALARLLELPDGELLDLVLGRGVLPAALDEPPVREVLGLLRAA